MLVTVKATHGRNPMAGNRSTEFRTLAAECLMQASMSADPIVRDALFEKAQTWLGMAAQAEASTVLSGQQQQQVQPKESEGDK
jgi:hypothetical protein